jgi:hypothetical protein
MGTPGWCWLEPDQPEPDREPLRAWELGAAGLSPARQEWPEEAQKFEPPVAGRAFRLQDVAALDVPAQAAGEERTERLAALAHPNSGAPDHSAWVALAPTASPETLTALPEARAVWSSLGG